ncbi:hypothetical protein N656DRAFT_641723 [Canariomyces notabilis]|uniref:Uncharacterized protein n=1 Tax=Canariomyces notabilis TaxID=2074819 RepID=A0AAN6TF77_9PEZI|nr:hypothetical protein N656DRAFT_641723 [Canariomyces arenarius]
MELGQGSNVPSTSCPPGSQPPTTAEGSGWVRYCFCTVFKGCRAARCSGRVEPPSTVYCRPCSVTCASGRSECKCRRESTQRGTCKAPVSCLGPPSPLDEAGYCKNCKTTCPPEAAESASQNANANTNFNPNPESNPKPNLGSDSVPQARNDDGAEREVDEGLGQPENASTAARNAARPDDEGADIVGAAAMSRIDRQIEIILSFPNDVNWDATAGFAFSPAVPTAGSTLGANQCNRGATERPESVISNATASTAPSSAVATAGSTPGGTERPESLDWSATASSVPSPAVNTVDSTPGAGHGAAEAPESVDGDATVSAVPSPAVSTVYSTPLANHGVAERLESVEVEIVRHQLDALLGVPYCRCTMGGWECKIPVICEGVVVGANPCGRCMPCALENCGHPGLTT